MQLVETAFDEAFQTIAEIFDLTVESAHESFADEPPVLHSLDALLQVGLGYFRLVDAGNTVIIATHDMQVASNSDWIIDIGPEATKAHSLKPKATAKGREIQQKSYGPILFPAEA